jgi:hypothetical protein
MVDDGDQGAVRHLLLVTTATMHPPCSTGDGGCNDPGSLPGSLNRPRPQSGSCADQSVPYRRFG